MTRRWPTGWLRDRFTLTVLAVYAACRLVSGVILVLVARRQVPTGWTGPQVTYLSFTQQWDAQWYQRIIEFGYPAQLPVDQLGHVQQNPWAFYPLYPLTSRLLIDVTHLDPVFVTSTWSLLLGAVAAVLLGRLLRRRLGPVAAVLVVLVYAVAPASPAFQVAYTESMAMVVLFGFLLALDSRRWAGAGALALVMGLTRPMGVPLAVVALVAAWLRWRARETDPIERREGGVLVGMLLATGVAGLIWPTVAAIATGRSNAYAETMAAWRASDSITWFGSWTTNARFFFGDAGTWLLVGVVAAVVILPVGPWARGLGPLLRTWALAYPTYLAAVLDPGTSLVRYLLPLGPVAAVVIGVGGRKAGTAGGPPGPDQWRRPRSWVIVLTALVVVASIAGQWWWTDGLWRFVPPTDWPP